MLKQGFLSGAGRRRHWRRLAAVLLLAALPAWWAWSRRSVPEPVRVAADTPALSTTDASPAPDAGGVSQSPQQPAGLGAAASPSAPPPASPSPAPPPPAGAGAAPVTGNAAPVAAAIEPPVPVSPAWHNSVAAVILSERHNLADPAVRSQVVARLAAAAAAEEEYTRATAERLGLPLRTPDGAILIGFQGEDPLYEKPDNLNAAISAATNTVRLVAPYNLSGDGYTIGLWEAGGAPYTLHHEFDDRLILVDSGDVSDHATHVAGTLIAYGLNSAVTGMAPRAQLRAFLATNDTVKMTEWAMAVPREPGRLRVSNHSYGLAAGWEGTVWYGVFSDDQNVLNDYAPRFGQYDSSSAAWDGLIWNAPYFLPFKSAGNHRNDSPPGMGARWTLNGANGTEYNYGIGHPQRDADLRVARIGSTGSLWEPGFDLITNKAVAKNVVTVGAVDDAVSGVPATRDITRAAMSTFSAYGPADDGRIKPDLVANGVSLTSLHTTSPTATRTTNGTSMATPNAAGSALLVVEQWERDRPGSSPLNSTLKALLLHTADDLGVAGPDYQYGWGLINTKAAVDVVRADIAVAGRGHIWEDVLPAAAPVADIPVTVAAGGQLRVTLTWSDPPGPATSAHNSRARRLVHDLNLRVISPDNTEHLPWVMPFVDDPENALMLLAPAVRGVNRVDNTEQVVVDAATPGNWRVEIRVAGALSRGDQLYSLVVTGGTVPRGLARWAWEEAGLVVADEASLDWTADPDGRGPLALRYALGVDWADQTGRAEVQPDGSVALVYRTNSQRPEIVVVPEWSTDLKNWTPVTPQMVSSTGTTTTWRALPPSGQGGFLRLRVGPP